VQTLCSGAAVLGLPLDAAQVAAFQRYAELLVATNQRVNLTSIVEPAAIETRHFLDSLTCALPLLERWGARDAVPPLRCADVGSGGGFPGVPLQIALPRLRFTLIESTVKKARFLEDLVAELDLVGIEVLAERAETLGQQPGQRESYDVAVARALAPLPTLLELTLPFLRPGGLLIAARRGDDEADQRAGSEASRLLGGGPLQVQPVTLAPLADGRVLTVVEKVDRTPAAYPRRPGLPAKRPLGRASARASVAAPRRPD
jgi:16S rRNA (guanine527-N7)-methyltransferase